MRATRLAAAMSLARRCSRLDPGVLAADPTFERATATQAFGEGITVEQRITLPSGVARVEAYVRSTDDSATFLAQISNPGEGAQTSATRTRRRPAA